MRNTAPEIKRVEGRDGYPGVARLWNVHEPLAEVVLLHGMVSHGEWYLSSCEYLASRGFRVHFLERRGSGLTQRDRGHVDDWQTWLNDVEDYLVTLPEERPRLLLGISWGGALATAVARRNGCLLTGLGLLCPGLFTSKEPNSVQRAAIRCLHWAGLGRRHVAVPLRDPANFTDSKDGQVYIANDPLALWNITISFAAASLKLIRYARQDPQGIALPTLLMLAGRDPITDNARTLHYVDRISHDDRQIIEYPDASHTLEFEPDAAQYLADLAQWCHRVGGGNRRI